MALPKEISPNPLITSTVEIRFNSEISDENVLGNFYPIFSANFPKIKDLANRIPVELKRERPEFKYIANYVLQNEKYSLSIGNNVIAFENLGTYQLWENYFPIIKENLELLKKTGLVKGVVRVGIRYASIFENKNNIDEALNFQNAINFNGYIQENQSLRSVFIKDNVSLLVQISNNAKLEKIGQAKIEGLYIDIDASSEKDLPTNIDDALYSLIDKLHYEQKSLLFEGIMKKEFLDSLNPKY